VAFFFRRAARIYCVSRELMPLRSQLFVLLTAVFYPLWLAAGLFDYVLHRRTCIESTSGVKESLYHVAQFASLAVALVCAALFGGSPVVLTIVILAVALHTWLGHADVVYTGSRRRIAPLEQLVHGFMAVLPVAATGVFAAMHWEELVYSPWTLRLRDPPLSWRAVLVVVGSYFVLAGLPILEEYLRTSGRLRNHQVEHGDQRRERNHA
jgi:hypothetical protein